MNDSKIKVLVVDDHTLFAEGTASLLSSEPDIAVAGIAASAEECLQLVRSILPHTVLLDINLPDSCGVNIIGKIKRETPDTGIIMLTGQSPEGYINASLNQGASGFLLKDCSKGEMVAAIRKAARGESYFSQSLSPYLKSAIIQKKDPSNVPNHSFTQTDPRENYVSSLTSRELEILELIAEGLRNKEIAECLGITKRTIDYHVGNILSKLEVKSRMEAVLLYRNLLTLRDL